MKIINPKNQYIMKHKSTIFANGLCTPPCGSSHGNLSSLRFRNSLLMPLLVLFLLMVGSSAMWGDCTFTANSTMYFDLRNAPWYNDGAYFIAKFYNASDSYLTEVSVSETSTSHVYSFQIPNRNDIDRIKIDRMAPDHGRWGYTIKLRATDAGSNDCMYMPAWTGDPVSCNWTTFGSGSITTGCGGAPAGDTFEGGEVFYMKRNTVDKDGTSRDFLEHGRCDFNLYDESGNYLSKALTAEEIPNTDPAMLKFTVPAKYAGTVWAKVKVKILNPDGSGSYPETKKGDIPKDGKNYLTNGNTMVWDTYTPPTPYTGDLYLIGGACTGLGWDPNNAVLLDNDGNGIYTITRQIDAVTGNNSDGFKFLESKGWANQWRPTPANASESLSDGSKAQNITPDADNIVISKNPGDPETKWHLTTSGTYTITIDLSDKDNGKMSIVEEETPAEPSLQPWSGDSYRDWYLTGDFTTPGAFDGWTQNPDGYKFAADGDNYQTASVILDPTDATRFHDVNGHKLTRFEIIRQGTWNDPRINKPNFDAGSSNCSLQTDWVDANSNRMTLELTSKSTITFRIWRWGTASNNADRKVTVTITPIPQVTVTFKVNNDTYAQQTIDQGGKATNPGTPTAPTGYRFDSWDWDFNTSINENTTINAQLVEQVTATFTVNDVTFAEQTIDKGSQASIPDGTPTAPSGYTFTGWNHDFSTAINSNITINAVLVAKTLESISLDESSIVMVMGGSNATLTPSYLPTDLIAGQQPTYEWSVSEGGVVTVDGGVITAVGEGTVTVTCTALGTDKSAECVVTVKDCNTVPTDIFAYTLGSDPTGDAAGSAVMNGMFDEADNTEEETVKRAKISLKDNDGNNLAALVDDNGKVKADNSVDDGSEYWYMIPAGTKAGYDLFYLKNAETNAYIYADQSTDYGQNGDWKYYAARTTETLNDADNFKWLKWINEGQGDKRYIIASAINFDANSNNGNIRGLYRTNVGAETWLDPYIKVGKQANNGYNHARNGMVPTMVEATVDNPAYMHSPDASGYYRFATGASVVATLNRAIKVNDVIRLEVKNPSKAAVSATVTIGSQVENINLAVGATSTEEITVTDANRPTSITIASNDVNFMLKSVVVNREMPNPGKDPNLAWSDTPSAAHQVADGDISSYFATRSGAGLITYTSSDESIATVADNGTVHPIAEGTVTITATLEQDGCYDDGSINYSLTLEDLPKPTITLTVPNAAVPQGSVQTISASREGDGTLTVSILSGSDATLTNNGDGTYTLRLGDNASNIVIEAATTRTLNYAQHAVTETVEVTNCAPDGRIIYSYALTGHDDLNAAEAEGGFYSQANLASVGTDDNPKTVSKVRIGLGNQNSLQYVYDPNTALGNHIDYGSGNTDDYYWYVIPKGMTNSSIQKFALKNASTGYYLAKAAGGGTGNWDWVQAISANSCDANTAQWHWAISYTNNNHPRLMNMDRSNGDGSFNKPEYFLHRNTSANNGVSKVVVGSSDGDQGNGELNAWFTDETNANNPDYFYSVTHEAHEYYILNGGTVTVSRASAFKAGDVITLNVFNRGEAASSTIKVADNTIADNVNGAAELTYTVAEGDGIQGQNSFVITPLNEYICLNSISIFRPKDESEFINPTLTWDEDLSEQQIINMNNSETGMTHAVSVNAPVNEAVVYSVSPAAKADINSATGALTLTNEAQNKDVLTVTATLPAIGCYNQAVASYEIYVKNLAAPSLSATFGTLQQGYASTLTVTTNSDAVPALSSISGFALNGDPVHDGNTYTYNIVVGSTAEAVSVHVALAVTSDYLAAEMNAADENVTTSSLAQLYENTPAEGTLVLEADYNEGLVIDKIITINGGGHSIGNLTVEKSGDLTLGSALTVQDFTICAKAGNTEIHAASGQVRNATNLTVNGEAYFLYTVDPNGHVQYGWYDFTVPFRVNVMTGIAGIDENSFLKEDFVNERDYAIMEHLGEKQANGEYSYKKFRGIMQPNKLYSITLDDDYNYNTVRFQKTNDGALVTGDEVTLNTYASTVDDKHANWNGVGNGTLHHADAAGGLSVDYVQVYQSGNKTFLAVDKTAYSFVIGSAFMVQQAGSMTLSQATHDELLAPARQESNQHSAISIQIAREDKPFSDQLFITANEDAEPVYTPGVDVAKAGNIGNVNVPQIWTNAYETKLCAHEAQLINGRAKYALSLYAPADGTYTLTGMNIPEGSTLYLTNNGRAIWNLSINDTYSLDLTKGTHSEYGLMIVKLNNAPTEIDAISSQPSGSGKVIRNGILYILHNGKVFNAQGAVMK